MKAQSWLVLLLAVSATAAAQTAPQAAATPEAPAATSTVSAKAAAPAASLPPQQQRMLDEADQLLGLAQKLKAEVNKTDQYTLSLNTLRRADDIEKLAKNLEKQVEHENR